MGASAGESEPTEAFRPKGLGVHIQADTPSDGKTPTVYWDVSGKGAVLCHWEIWTRLQSFLNDCPDAATAAVIAEVDRVVERIDAFILEHSSKPVTQADLDASRAVERSGGAKQCEGNLAQFYTQLAAHSAAELRSAIDELVSIPREPVLNPCL